MGSGIFMVVWPTTTALCSIWSAEVFSFSWKADFAYRYTRQHTTQQHMAERESREKTVTESVELAGKKHDDSNRFQS